MKEKIKGVWVIIGIVALSGWLWHSVVTKGEGFTLGLDLAGGSALTYQIKTEVLPEDVSKEDAVDSLRDVVERRVNLFGVREPTVITQFSRLENEWRLVVELPGVTDVEEAAKLIGETPVLDFRTEKAGSAPLTSSSSMFEFIQNFEQTPLTGSYLKRAALMFDPTTNRPMVELTFNDEGSKLFASITKANIGKQVSIFLDGVPISSPVVNEEITGGKAVISGTFTTEEARQLVGRLNSGALPVPIELAGKAVVGATLGEKAIEAGKASSLYGFLLVILFMAIWYRLPGLVAGVALVSYVAVMLSLFKLIPVTLTASGIAGFIISIGLAVDANVLTFERMKEELRSGKGLKDALEIGFARAWTSIRDSHLAAIIVSVVLFFIGTSIVKGFAFTFFLGAVISLFSAQVITRTLLRAVAPRQLGKVGKFLFGSGLKN